MQRRIQNAVKHFCLALLLFFNIVTHLYSLNDAISSFGFYGLPCLSRNLFLDLSCVQTYFFVSFIVEFFVYLLFFFVSKQGHRVSVVLLRYLSKLRDFYILNSQVYLPSLAPTSQIGQTHPNNSSSMNVFHVF